MHEVGAEHHAARVEEVLVFGRVAVLAHYDVLEAYIKKRGIEYLHREDI